MNDKDKAQQTGAHVAWVNLAPKPIVSDLPEVLVVLDDADYFEVLRCLKEDAVYGIAFSIMTRAATPADLEYIYRGLMLTLLARSTPRDVVDRCTRIYHRMWNYFTGGNP